MVIRGLSITTGRVVEVHIQDDRIAEISEPGFRPPPGALGDENVWVAPGFIDLQVNGYRGHDFNHGAWAGTGEVVEAVEPILQDLARAGTAACLPTITTNSPEAMGFALRRLHDALVDQPELEPQVLGVHLEGPFISPEDGPRGAHPLDHVRDPDWGLFQSLQEASGERIRLVTLAPELPGALKFIRQLVETGVVVALGHTGAEPAVIREAVRAGATLSTHLGNGAHGHIRRHPNYIWEQMAADELSASLIADLHHLPIAVLRSLVRAKRPERVILVSDAVSLGGLPPGRYQEGRLEVCPDGKIVVAGTPYLAGAGLLLDHGVANAVRFGELSLAQAVDAVTSHPAALLGVDGELGCLRPGARASLTLFRVPSAGPLEIVATVAAGRVIYSAEGVA